MLVTTLLAPNMGDLPRLRNIPGLPPDPQTRRHPRLPDLDQRGFFFSFGVAPHEATSPVCTVLTRHGCSRNLAPQSTPHCSEPRWWGFPVVVCHSEGKPCRSVAGHFLGIWAIGNQASHQTKCHWCFPGRLLVGGLGQLGQCWTQHQVCRLSAGYRTFRTSSLRAF